MPRRFDHIDLRVNDLKKVEAFYRALLPELGFKLEQDIPGWIQYTSGHGSDVGEFFGITEDSNHVPNKTRIAFWASSREEVDRLAEVLQSIDAHKIEGPDFEAQGYYAVFFEDLYGNCLEVCHRTSN